MDIMALEHCILCKRVMCVLLETIQTKCQDNELLLQLKTFACFKSTAVVVENIQLISLARLLCRYKPHTDMYNA